LSSSSESVVQNRDPARDLAPRGGYLFSSSLVVHRVVGVRFEIFLTAARILPTRPMALDEKFVSGKSRGFY
jgi:hypothetical protein